MKQEAEEEMNVLFTKLNYVFKFVKFMRKEGRNIEGKGCMKDKDRKLVVSEKDRGKLWKDHECGEWLGSDGKSRYGSRTS